jgi:hypothetical protein
MVIFLIPYSAHKSPGRNPWVRVVWVIIFNIQGNKYRGLRYFSWSHMGLWMEWDRIRPSRWHSDIFPHTQQTPQPLSSLVPVIFRRKHKSQPQLQGGLQGKCCYLGEHLLGINCTAGVQVVWSYGKNGGGGTEPQWEPGLLISRPVPFFAPH